MSATKTTTTTTTSAPGGTGDDAHALPLASFDPAHDDEPCAVDVRELVDAIHGDDPWRITRATLGQFTAVVSSPATRAFAVLPAPSASSTAEQFAAADALARALVEQHACTSLRIVPRWTARTALTKTVTKTETTTTTTETTTATLALVVPGLEFRAALDIAAKFALPGFLSGGPASGGDVRVFDGAGGARCTLGPRLSAARLHAGLNALHDDGDRVVAFVGHGTFTPTSSLLASSYERERYGVQRFHSLWGQRP